MPERPIHTCARCRHAGANPQRFEVIAGAVRCLNREQCDDRVVAAAAHDAVDLIAGRRIIGATHRPPRPPKVGVIVIELEHELYVFLEQFDPGEPGSWAVEPSAALAP